MKIHIRPSALVGLAVAAMLVADVGYATSAGANANPQVSTVMEFRGQKLAVSSQEMKALSNLGSLIPNGQKGSQDRALAEARRAAGGRDARYVLALYEFELGTLRGDNAMRTPALDVLIDSELTRRDRLPGYIAARGQIAYQAGDFATAERHWARLAELTPSDPHIFANLAQVRLAKQDASGAMDLLSQAIAAREASGQAVSEGWYRQRLSIAQQGKLVEPGIDAARALVSAHPTPENWRETLVVYRQLVDPEEAFEIDLFRLTRHVGALARAPEYQRMAQLLGRSGEPVEAKAVIDEGIMRGLLDAETSPTREIIAELDRGIAGVGGRSSAQLKTIEPSGSGFRLGMSQLRTSQRAEAEATLRTVAQDRSAGRYSDLAFFWLTFLSQGQSTRTNANQE